MPNSQRPSPSQPVDTIVIGSVSFNAERPGRCAQCHTLTTTRRVVRTTYRPPALNRREQDHLTRGDRTEAQVVDGYLQRFARRQLRGDFGATQQTALCARCATGWLVQCLEHGPGLESIPEARAGLPDAIQGVLLLAGEALARNKPLFVAVVWRIERGPDGRSQASAVTHSEGPIAPQILIRAQSDLRRYAAFEFGQPIV